MSTDNDILRYFHYYHGEPSCPFTPDDGHKSSFWTWEQMYLSSPHRNIDWEALVPLYLDRGNTLNGLLTQDVPSYIKGLYVFISEMICKWMPYNPDVIFEY